MPLRIDDVDEWTKLLCSGVDDEATIADNKKWIKSYATGLPSIGGKHERYSRELDNVDVSLCYACDKVAIWVGSVIVWPASNDMPRPNSDLPAEIAQD